MVERTLDSALQPAQRGYLQLAKASADSLLNISDDGLDFSKIEARQFEFEQIPFSRRDCRLALRTHAKRAAEKNLPLQMAFDAALAAGDLGQPYRIAHSMTGSAGNFAAAPTMRAASQLERMCRDGQIESAAPVAALARHVESLAAAPLAAAN